MQDFILPSCINKLPNLFFCEMFDMVISSARSCRNPIFQSRYLLNPSSISKGCKINDRKTSNSLYWWINMKTLRKTISKLTAEKRVKDPIKSFKIILLQPDFAIWFLPSIFHKFIERWKKIRNWIYKIGYKRAERGWKKIPDFDMLIKTSKNRFWVDETFSFDVYLIASRCLPGGKRNMLLKGHW